MHFFKIYCTIAALLLFNCLAAQNYHAINGSSYAGSLGVGNNPASIVHVPYAWDVTPFSIQVKQSTNALVISNYSLLSLPANATITATNGEKKRFAFANQDIHLFNTRISLNAKAAIAFGANIRSYVYATSSQSNYQDSSFALRDFMKINTNNLPFSAEAASITWAELYATYAQTIYEDDSHLLNAGLTLKVNRNLAGGYAKAQDINYVPGNNPNTLSYLLTNGNLQYGYSSNVDIIDSNRTSFANTKAFLRNTYSSVTADVGFEYIIQTDEGNEEGGDYAYETKVGVSVLDIGSNKYKHGSRSRLAIGVRPGITDTLLEKKFTNINSVDDFNDSLGSIVNSFTQIVGNFYIYQPTRFMINVDQHIANNFFVNAALTIPLLSLVAKKTLHIKDMNLLAITPRWELKGVGAYLPILVNNQKQLWVGGAIKAGPLLLGTHNLANLFSKNKSQNGGFYLALTIRPGKKYDRQAHQAKDKAGNKFSRNLQCPKF